MTEKEAKAYWQFALDNARERQEIHWEADEKREHREYIEALVIAINALEKQIRQEENGCSFTFELPDTDLDEWVKLIYGGEDKYKAIMLAEKSINEALPKYKEAYKKQIPKKTHRNYKKYTGVWCSCGAYIGIPKSEMLNGTKYCAVCGQAIDWTDTIKAIWKY